jgi:hypothetical protein
MAADATIHVNAVGSLTGFVPANNNAAVIVKNAAGRLMKVIVTTIGTAATTFFDNASAASGNKLLVIPASPTLGAVYDVQVSAANGITCDGLANCSGCTVCYE